jgi:hypothetical protein
MNNTRLVLKLIIIGSIGFLFLLIILMIFQRTTKPEEPNPTPTITLIPTKPGVSQPTQSLLAPTKAAIDDIDPYSLGAAPDAHEEFLTAHPEQLSIDALRDQTPIENYSFRLEYSYAEVKFFVYLKPPFVQNKQIFLDFLKQKGIEQSLDQFVYKSE